MNLRLIVTIILVISAVIIIGLVLTLENNVIPIKNDQYLTGKNPQMASFKHLNSNEFGFKFYNQISNNNDNLFFSPISIDVIFAIIFEGARGDTREQMLEMFDFNPNSIGRHGSYNLILTILNSEHSDFTLNIDNALWIADKFQLDPDYQGIIENQYLAESQNVDFVTNDGVDRINSWVNENTNGKIPDIIEQDSTGPLTLMAATNTIYFNGLWEIQFNPGFTHDREFYPSPDEKVNVQTMKQKNKIVNYYEGDNVKIIELPYKGDNVSMYLIKSIEKHQLNKIEEKLTLAYYNELKSKLSEEMVTVYLPKFSLESDYDLKQILSAMGMTLPFDDNNAELYGIANYEQIFISKAIHKSAIDVHELGTEAAAATVGMAELSSGSPNVFRADNPFIYIIQDNETEQILFMGRLSNPNG